MEGVVGSFIVYPQGGQSEAYEAYRQSYNAENGLRLVFEQVA